MLINYATYRIKCIELGYKKPLPYKKAPLFREAGAAFCFKDNVLLDKRRGLS
jgi:hypothetical protein